MTGLFTKIINMQAALGKIFKYKIYLMIYLHKSDIFTAFVFKNNSNQFLERKILPSDI